MTFKITFTIKSINWSNNPTKIEIDEVDFPTGNGDEKAKITEIFFAGQEKDKLKDTFQDKKTYQMTSDVLEVEDDQHPTMAQNTASAGGFSSSKKEPDKLPNYCILETEKKLRVVYNRHNDTIKITEQGSTNAGSWGSSTTSSGGQKKNPSGEGTENKPQSTSNTSNTNQDDSENSGGNSEETQNNSSNNTDKTPPPQPAPSQPSQEEVSNSGEKLKQSTQSGNKDEISESIRKNQELEDKGSKSSENSQAEKDAREKLAQLDKEKYCQTIFETIQDKLKNNGVNVDQLDAESKSEFEKLKNKEITEKSKIDESEKKIVKNVYEEAATKKLTNLENKSNKAIKSKNRQKIKEVKQELTWFINNPNYQSSKKNAAELLKKLEAALETEHIHDKNGDIPWKIVVPALVVVAFLIGLVIYARKRRISNS